MVGAVGNDQRGWVMMGAMVAAVWVGDGWSGLGGR
jgi:hypothetical protein